MIPRRPNRTRVAVAACLAALATGALATSASAQLFGRRKAPEPVVAPPSVAPPIALSDSVLAAAGAYRAYMRKAATVSAGFKAGEEVESALELAEASEPQQLSKGVVAYAALLALQDPTFVAGVRPFAKDPAQREQVAAALIANPAYAAQMPGAGSAATLIVGTLDADGAKVLGVGKAVKQSAYDVQKSAWSKLAIPNRDVRLARAKTLAAASMATTPEELTALRATLPTEAGPGAPMPEAMTPAASAAPPYTATVARGMAIAALAVLGRAGDDNDPGVQSLLADTGGGFCHNMAKLNLYQCLAVAKPFYEDVFCLGQHILIDTGQCVQGGAGLAPEPVAVTTVAAATEPGDSSTPKARPSRRGKRAATGR